MSRQGLRSTKNDDRNVTEEPGRNNREKEDLDNTLTEMSKDRESTNMPWPRGAGDGSRKQQSRDNRANYTQARRFRKKSEKDDRGGKKT